MTESEADRREREEKRERQERQDRLDRQEREDRERRERIDRQEREDKHERLAREEHTRNMQLQNQTNMAMATTHAGASTVVVNNGGGFAYCGPVTWIFGILLFPFSLLCLPGYMVLDGQMFPRGSACGCCAPYAPSVVVAPGAVSGIVPGVVAPTAAPVIMGPVYK